MFVPTLGNDNRGEKSRGRGGGGRKVEGEHGPRRSDGVVSRVTSQLSSRRNPRPYLFAIYAHLERNLGRAPTAPPTASIRRKNVSLGYVRPPFSLSLSLSSRVKAARIVFQNFHGGHQWRRALIRSDATIPGPPRRFSRIRLGRHEFATLFRHGLFIPFLFDLFPPLLSRRTTDTAPFFFLSVFDGNSFAGTIGFLC